MIGSLQPIKAIVGEDVILPCHLESAMNIVKMTVKWMRPDLNNQTVLLWQHGEDLTNDKHPSIERRTSLYIEKLKHGDISLKLSKVKLADQGKYICYIPERRRAASVQLVVAEAQTGSTWIIVGIACSIGVVLCLVCVCKYC